MSIAFAPVCHTRRIKRTAPWKEAPFVFSPHIQQQAARTWFFKIFHTPRCRISPDDKCPRIYRFPRPLLFFGGGNGVTFLPAELGNRKEGINNYKYHFCCWAGGWETKAGTSISRIAQPTSRINNISWLFAHNYPPYNTSSPVFLLPRLNRGFNWDLAARDYFVLIPCSLRLRIYASRDILCVARWDIKNARYPKMTLKEESFFGWCRHLNWNLDFLTPVSPNNGGGRGRKKIGGWVIVLLQT